MGESNATEPLREPKYEKVDLKQYAEAQDNLDLSQKAALFNLLEKHKELFEGKRGNWKGKPISIELKDDAEAVWSRPYPIPLKNRDVVEKEFDRQCAIGAMRKLSAEEIEERDYCFPAFGTPKSDGTIRVVVDFRKLNPQLKRREYPLRTIEEIFTSIGGFVWASSIDLNMGYLSIALTEPSKKILTIVMPFGFFECCVLPMGVSPATDKFQARMVGLFASMSKETRPDPYIDDILHAK